LSFSVIWNTDFLTKIIFAVINNFTHIEYFLYLFDCPFDQHLLH